ncbi:MAG TPA: type II toxin-antitoxin system RelE/ParE family toxin [Candidatus Bathyarchaeia archaeon]|nr:type II toxin-antitoxin system RelE/ParE family toxin [Candidatus Bathyarchaeia archaeon]
MPKYGVIAHRRVLRFIRDLKDENLKNVVKDALTKLEDYPAALREMDVEKIKGLERAFRIRIGKYRIIFHVDKTEKTIYVTHAEARKRVYEKLG